MKSVDQNIVFRQYLSLLPRSVLECPLVNYDYDKLSVYALVKSMILANLFRWRSWDDIEQGIRAKPAILIELELDSISGSQLTRARYGFRSQGAERFQSRGFTIKDANRRQRHTV